MTIAEIIAKALGLRLKQVANTIELLQTGATIPLSAVTAKKQRAD